MQIKERNVAALKIALSRQVDIALDMLNNCGFEAYAVGGCIRDSLLNITPHDWDICTNALPQQILSVFDGFKTATAGIKHGTVAVLIEGEPIEITTYRIDGEYADNRRPESVSFTSQLSEDLSRRDFTVNAMAYSKSMGFVDIFGGAEDLRKKLIRCVGSPDLRFGEDALRIVRAVRFAAQLNFKIESQTHLSILKNKGLLNNIAVERIRAEFDRLICSSGAVEVLDSYREVIAVFIPDIVPMFGFEQNNPHHCYDVWRHTLASIANAETNLLLRLSLFFHDIGKPHSYSSDSKGIGHFYGHSKISADITEQAMRRLKYDNAAIQTVVLLVKLHDVQFDCEPKAIKHWLNKIGEQNLRLLLKIKICDNLAQHPDYRERAKKAKECELLLDGIIKQNDCFCLKQLAATGGDLINIGMQQGKAVGEMLNILLQKVIDGECENDKEKLLALAKKILNENGCFNS